MTGDPVLLAKLTAEQHSLPPRRRPDLVFRADLRTVFELVQSVTRADPTKGKQ